MNNPEIVPPTPRRLGLLLLLSFGLTIASFVASTQISDFLARGIGVAAESIVTNAVPSIGHLSNMRTAVRHIEVSLQDYTDRRRLGVDDEASRRDLVSERGFLRSEWSGYLMLPLYSDERSLHPQVVAAMSKMNAAIEHVLYRLSQGDSEGAGALLGSEAKPAIDELDSRLHATLGINTRSALTFGEHIMTLRRQAHVWAITLDVVSALFSVAAAMAAVHIVRQYTRLMERRVSELEQFAGRVAHDVRSPLASVGLALELTLRAPDIEPRVRAALTRGSGTLQRVGQLVDGLLVFAYAGAAPGEGPRADAAEVLHGVIEGLLPAAQEKDIELKLARVDPCVLTCSPGILTSIVSNLVGNAIKYMGESTVRRVEVCLFDLGGKARLEVTDTGPGIPLAIQPKLFDPYLRASASAIPGMGLGLATVRRLAEAHRGATGVKSTEGKGSLFWVELPKAK